MATIRLATPADLSTLSALACETFRETFTHYDPAAREAFLQEYNSEDALGEYLSHPSCQSWIAEEDGKAIGYAIGMDYETGPRGFIGPDIVTDASAAELRRLYVYKSTQGTGLGKRLMETAMEWMRKELKATRMYLGVWSGNTHALEFYRRNGFEKVGEFDYPAIGDIVDREFILRKRL